MLHIACLLAFVYGIQRKNLPIRRPKMAAAMAKAATNNSNHNERTTTTTTTVAAAEALKSIIGK